MTEDERLEELLLLWEEQAETGRRVTVTELCLDCPELAAELQRRIDGLGRVEWLVRLSDQDRAGPRKFLTLVPGAEPVPGYRLLVPLGQGGFGQVWGAIGPAGLEVALKFLPRAVQSSQSEWKALDILRGIRHPNLLALLGCWDTANWLVLGMELADQSLHDRLAEARAGGLEGIPVVELFGYLRQAAACIDHLHAAHIHHRDIKPQNLLLKDGCVKVADFGLARIVDHSVTGHTGNMTVAYAAPEFLDGKTSRHSDQYSLAVTFCQLRVGRLPFEGSPAQVVAGHLSRSPDLTMLPPAERVVIHRALSKRPGDRWPSCTSFAEELTSAGENRRPRSGILSRRLRWWTLWSLAGCLGLSLAYWSESGTPLIPEGASLVDAPRRGPSRGRVLNFDGACRIVTPIDRFAPVTLEAWIRPAGYSGGRFEKTVIGSDIAGHSGISLGFDFSSRAADPMLGAQLLPFPTAISVSTSASIKVGRWSHVAAAFGPSETMLFLDGNVVARGSPTSGQGGTPFVVGNAGESNLNHYFVGTMRAVRISRGLRYTGDFTPPPTFNSDETAIVIYDGDSVHGETVTDLSGKGNHGTIEGSKGLVVRNFDD